MQASATERRKAPRRKTFQWQGALKLRPAGATGEFDAAVKDSSDIGLAIETAARLRAGDLVAVSGVLSNGLSKTTLAGRAAKVVRVRTLRDDCHSVALTYSNEQIAASNEEAGPDYYEALQLSPKADVETIHRVYRLLAQRYHPDNAETGDSTHFKAILEAYRVISDPEKRAAYDLTLAHTRQIRWKIFDHAQASLGKEGERRKRSGILGLLYTQRMHQPQQPALGLHEFEELLGCPREHLEFALWYLKEGGLVTRTDNGRYAITIKGIDQNETEPDTKLPDNRLLPQARG